ncbi:MAG: TRAP transporter large permease subunit [Aquabacterium sp.]|uniref:TRAP transporter large permease subunit n=1 Tax=Aquabacterium sp. TaxID=1872578 RepID=UPI0027264346|nr:TRAP transporter large permease subunit [Aquabacterium sp.]MDO9001887.1 TRAP transporter large permease subunit [Aquabacterium sp.]
MSDSRGGRPTNSHWADWLLTLPTVMLLVSILILSTGEMVHGQLLKLGEVLFGDPAHQIQYFMLRADPVAPACDPKLDIDAELARRQAASAPRQAPKDDIDAMFGDTRQDPATMRASIAEDAKVCSVKYIFYEGIKSHITPSLVMYRTLETSFLGLFMLGSHNRVVILLLLLTFTSVHATLGHHHICIRPPRRAKEHLIQSWSMLVACCMMLYSVVRFYQFSIDSGLPIEAPQVNAMWMVLFGAMALASAYRIWRPLAPAVPDHGPGHGWLRSLDCVSLVAAMFIIGSLYFFMQGHPAGPAIYANKLVDFMGLPLALALHIWAGMLFKQSRLVDLFMSVIRPWKLSPQALTYIILLAAGLPTAYAGVSSVFVIAAGAIIYHEVRASGATSQYALAATAMSGSLGAVLRPSLLVVGIAALNRQVTTTQLFYWGGLVFALTSTMFFIASQLAAPKGRMSTMVSPRVAVPAMLHEMKAILPYAVLVVVILTFYQWALDTKFDEHSAASILPILMLLVLVLDKALASRSQQRSKATGLLVATAGEVPAAHAEKRPAGTIAAIKVASSETVEHVGSYICLMVATQLVGGMVERSEVMNAFPQHFANVWVAMAFLVVVKVLLGMVMEPLGAIILVSSTLAPLAYQNGIHPVNFWMMVLVAFELGYLTPPVALNQLLTRQVVGEAEMERSDREVAGLSFYRRHERWILPFAVMSVSLVIVAFGPLVVLHVELFQPLLHWWP